jgi:DNA-binding CsgD family transcriptional regulator
MSALSSRELEITSLIAWGYLRKEIAGHLGISFYTVEAHIKNIYSKLGFSKDTDLTRWYFFQQLDVHLVNPFRKMISVFLLLVIGLSILQEQPNVRQMRSNNIRINTVRLATGKRARSRNVYQLTA